MGGQTTILFHGYGTCLTCEVDQFGDADGGGRNLYPLKVQKTELLKAYRF